MTRKKRKAILRAIDGLARPGGAAALQERLRLLAPGREILSVSASDLLIALNELQAYRIACEVAGKGHPDPGPSRGKRGRKLKLEDDHGREEACPGRVNKLIRFRPEVAASVAAFARERGGTEPWSFNRAVQELLSLALRDGGK